MKILFAIKSLNSAGGGAERVLAEVTSGLAERGHNITILTYDKPNGDSFYPLCPSISRIDLGIGCPQSNTNVWETLKRIFVLRQTVVKLSPDVVVGFMHSIFIPLGFALIGTKLPIIASEHIGVEHYKYHPLEYFLLNFTPFVTKRTTVISEAILNGFNAHLKRKMLVIPNPVNLSVKNMPKEVESDLSRKIILSVGRLTPQKDHKTLLEAYSILANDFPDWDLKIFGDGELRPRLETQIKAYGLQRRIQLAATKQNISEEFLRAQLFVVSSLYESFGLATAEALANGLPAVGFASCPGTNELIRHDHNGLLVCGDQRAVVLAEGMRRLMDSPSLRKRLGDAGPNSMADFSKETICDKWEDLLQNYTCS